MKQSDQKSPLPFNQAGLYASDCALMGALPLVKRRRPIPSDTIHQFQSLSLKLAPYLRAGGFPEGTRLFLSQQELRVIDEALKSFRDGIRHHIASTAQRASVLQEIEELHQSFQAYLSES